MALLLRSDTPLGDWFDPGPEPEPELGPARVLPSLPQPVAAKPLPKPSALLPQPVPTLSETLVGPRAKAVRARSPLQLKAISRAGSALSGALAGPVSPVGLNRLATVAEPAPANASAPPLPSAPPEAQAAAPVPSAADSAEISPVAAAGELLPVAPETSTLARTGPDPPPEPALTEARSGPAEAQAAEPASAPSQPPQSAPLADPVAIAASVEPAASLPAAPAPPAPAPAAPEIERPPIAQAGTQAPAPQAARPAPPAAQQTVAAEAPAQFVPPPRQSAPVDLTNAPPKRVDSAAQAVDPGPPSPGAETAAAHSTPQADAKPVPTLAAVFAGSSRSKGVPALLARTGQAPGARGGTDAGEGLAMAAPGSATAPLAAPAPGIGVAGVGQVDANAGLTQPSTLQQIAGGAPPDLSDSDELILELRLPNGTLADTLVGYGTRKGVYLPLGPLARTLDLAIVVSDEGQYASGWFLDEKRTLTIDLRQRALELQGKPQPFPNGVFVARNGEMYVLADYLSELLPLSLKVDLRDQSVTITTREPFPFETRLAREEARSRLGNQQNATLADVFKRERTDWRLIDFPLIDLETRAISDSTLGTRGEADVRLSTDLAYMNAQTYFSGTTRDGLTAARIELGRQDPDGNLLGPLGATEFQIGDVSTPALPIGLRGTSGRGAFVSNAKLQRASVFDKIDLRGELPDGYEVELYRNNVLIGSTRTAVNGRFEFLQVPVDFGLNIMRLVFFGPQGQRREEVRQIAVGDGRLGKGEFEYAFGMAQKERNLIEVNGPFFRPNRDYGAWRLTGQMAYGFTKDITGVMSAARFETDLGDRWQLSTGIRAGIGGVSTQLDTAIQNGGGKAIQVGLGTRLFGSALTVSHGEYFGQFIDEVRSFDSAILRRATELNLSGGLDFSLGKTASLLPYSLRARRLEFADGHIQADATLRGSVRLGTLMASKSFEYQENTFPNAPGSRVLTGTFDLARLSGSRLDLRGGFGYRILPSLKALSASIQADYAVDDRTLVNATAGHSFDNDETFLGLSATRRFDRFTLGFDSNYNLRSKAYSVALRLGVSLGRDPITHDVFVDSPGLATAGAVAIRAFHDLDGDDRFGPADQPLEGVTFFSGSQSKVTNANGLALIGNLSSGTRASLQVDPDTIQDIAMAPRARGFEVVPRPGRIHVKDFAIVDVSEVAGTAFFDQAGARRAVSGLRLELVDTQGKVVAEARSESDGYFFFEQVVPGRYAVRIEAEQATRLGIAVKAGSTLEVKVGQVLPMLELIVEDTKVAEPAP